MTRPAIATAYPLAVSEKGAAKMLDMQVKDFRRLRASGALPPPKKIGDLLRWRVADLESILNGEAAKPPIARFEP